MVVTEKQNRFIDLGLLLLRIGVGITFVIVGSPKMMGGPEEWEEIGTHAAYIGITAWPMFWGFVITVAEFFGGFLLMLGLFFRPALVVLLLSTIITISSSIGQSAEFVYTANAIAVGFIFLSMFFTGSGRYSLDRNIWSRRRRRI